MYFDNKHFARYIERPKTFLNYENFVCCIELPKT